MLAGSSISGSGAVYSRSGETWHSARRATALVRFILGAAGGFAFAVAPLAMDAGPVWGWSNDRQNSVRR